MTFPDMEMESLAAFLANFMCVNLSSQNTEQGLSTVEDMHKFVFYYIFTYVLDRRDDIWNDPDRL